MSKFNVKALPINKVWLGEGPHWDSKTQKLYYVDLLRNSVHRYDPITLKESKIVIEDKAQGENSVTLVVPIENESNKFIISHGLSLSVLEWNGENGAGGATNLKSLHIVGNDSGNENGRFNDGKCDSNGRLWAGTMGFYNAGDISSLQRKKGRLYKLEKNGKITNHLDNIDISNGLSWSSDNKIFYYVDSLTYRVDAFDYDLSNGNISNRRSIFDLKANKIAGIPDGLTIDVNGNLWLAVFGGGKILHIDPITGKLIDQIDLPTSNITSVAFGGPNLDILYVTSAQNDLSKEQLVAQPTAGALFEITNLGTRGLSSGVAYGGKV